MTNADTDSVLPYSVNLWGSHPDAGNDDCWTGADFATLDQALDCYRALAGSIGNFALADKLDKVTGYDSSLHRPRPSSGSSARARESPRPTEGSHEVLDRGA